MFPWMTDVLGPDDAVRAWVPHNPVFFLLGQISPRNISCLKNLISIHERHYRWDARLRLLAYRAYERLLLRGKTNCNTSDFKLRRLEKTHKSNWQLSDAKFSRKKILWAYQFCQNHYMSPLKQHFIKKVNYSRISQPISILFDFKPL